MKQHLKRRLEYSKGLIPEEGSEGYEKSKRIHEEIMAANPELRKKLKKNYKEAVNTLRVQDHNGVGKKIDQELRYYLREFNSRSWEFGHRKMPIMFNIMEAFYDLDKRVNSWKLLEEEDYSISFFNFIDFYTSNDFNYNISDIKENIVEDLIYNYHVDGNIREISFKTENGKEFVVDSISLIRRGNEVNLFFITGEITDTIEATKNLEPLNGPRIPGKEKIHPDEHFVREAVQLDNDPSLWKTLIACRFDLESETIDSKYIAVDEGNSFRILTDDRTGLMKNGEWLIDDGKETYEDYLKRIEQFNSIFELAKAVLYLPEYFNHYEEEIKEESIETDLKSIIKTPQQKREYKNVPDKYKIRTRSIWSITIENRLDSDDIILKDRHFKVERSGYWKDLRPEDFGTDKKNRPIKGRTWVSKRESYYEAKEESLIVRDNKKVKYTNPGAGYIYVMRNPNFEENLFKIGLTTKSAEERAKQLSKTSVPDKFQVMNTWNTKDCERAEKEIHEILSNYRVDSRREFFLLEMSEIVKVINKVVERINNSN